MERSIDLLATPNWLCSAHRTEILILIRHSFQMQYLSASKTKPSRHGLKDGSFNVAKFNEPHSQEKFLITNNDAET